SRRAKMYNLLLRVGYWMALVVAGFIVAAAFLTAPVPAESIEEAVELLLIPTTVLILVYFAYRSSAEKRLAILRFVALVAGLSLGGSVVMRLLSLFPTFHAHVITPYLFGLDGGAAEDAAVFEVWCQAWVCLAILVLAAHYILKYVRHAAKK